MSRIFRLLSQLLDVDLTSTPPADGDALTFDQGTDKWVPGSGGGGAPTDADYLVGTANGDLDSEIVVGTSPGGELGGTWASPTVDATHSGSSHATVQAAAEATAAAALSSHASDTTGIHGIADTSALLDTGDIGSTVAALSHVHAGEDITSGTVADARIASTIARDSEVTSAISTSEAGQVRDGDAAGGVLGGTYPNPSFAADMATQAELDAHINDTSDAHDASAISVADSGNHYTGTDVESVLAEVAGLFTVGSQKIFDSTLSVAAASIDTGAAGIPGGYDILEVWFFGRTTEAVDVSNVNFRVNNDSGSNYDRSVVQTAGTTVTGSQTLASTEWQVGVPGSSGETGAAAIVRITIPGYDQTTFHKVAESNAGLTDDTAANNRTGIRSFRWKSTAAITRLAVTAASGNLLAGSRLVIFGRTVAALASGGYMPGGTDVALADGGTGASLADPNADRIMFWDDSAGAVTWLTTGTNLTITSTTIDAAGGASSTGEEETLVCAIELFA